MTAKLTKHQRETLQRLGRLSTMLGPPPGRWIHERDCGGPAALGHLYRKGAVERDIRTGPRGGEHVFYRPNEEGYRILGRVGGIKRHVADAPAPGGRMTTGEIDTLLIEARDHGKIARVYVGPARAEIRGYIGPVARDENGALRIRIGQRSIALAGIREVVVERGA